MYRTVLVPLDGSELSERAVPFGRTLAEAGNAHLILLRVVPPTDWRAARELDPLDKAMSDADAYVSGLVVRPEGDTSVEALAYQGDPARLIVDEARARPASLIVMSTHGRSGASELVYGSVTEEVIRRTEAPVLVIPPRCDRSWSAAQRGRVLIPLDGSEFSEAILPEALDVAKALHANVTLMRMVAETSYLHVEGYPDPVGVPTEGMSAGEAEAYLNEVATRFRSEGRQVKTLVPEGREAASAIVQAAEQPEVALIAMATHGRGSLAELVLGSVAATVVKQATVPVLLLWPPTLR